MTRLFPFAAILAAFSAGCNAPAPARDAGDPTRGYVRVALTFTRDGSGVRFDAQGHFVRFHAADGERVAAALGMGGDRAIPLGTCRRVDGAVEIERALQTASRDTVELLDAGRLLVKGPLDATMLQPRHYPEITPYVGGVVYGAADPAALALAPGALYEVAGEGGDEVGAFQAQGSAPRAFPSLEVIAPRRGGDLEVRFGEAPESAEPLEINVAWRARSGAGELRCRVRDDGAYRVPHELLPFDGRPSNATQISSPSAPGGAARPLTVEVTALRTQRAPLYAPGAGRGELTIGLREVVSLQLPSGDER